MKKSILDSVYFGTSSWSEKSWEGAFYPEGLTESDYLSHYSTQFRTVESDVTYYRIPTRNMVLNWHRRTPDEFIFSAKFPRSIVHGGEGKIPDPRKILQKSVVESDVLKFLEIMRLLGKKLGPLVLQFPYFNKSVFPNPGMFLELLDAFLDWLPVDFLYAVEIRNRNYLTGELLRILKNHAIPMVFVDHPYMPAPHELARIEELETGKFQYVRLIGDRKTVEERTETFDRIVVDKSERLKNWALFLKERIPVSEATFIYANNHFAGHGPATIRELIRILQSLFEG